MSGKNKGILDHVFNVVLIMVLIYLVLLPGSPLRTRITSWRAQSRLADLAEENWQDLAATTARMDTSLSRQPVIIEFGNYECPFCQRSHQQLETMMESEPSFAVAFRHFAVSDRARDAARAAICAEFQGRFKAMNALLFENSDWKDERNWLAVARAAGVPDLADFEQCLTGEAVTSRLKDDMRLAEILEVRATPTFFYRFGARIGYQERMKLAELVEAAR